MRKVSLLPLIFLFVCVSIPERNSTGDFEISQRFIWCHCVWLETTPSLISRAGGEPNFCGQVRQAQELQPQFSTQEGLLEFTSQKPLSGNSPNKSAFCARPFFTLTNCCCLACVHVHASSACSTRAALIYHWFMSVQARLPPGSHWLLATLLQNK